MAYVSLAAGSARVALRLPLAREAVLCTGLAAPSRGCSVARPPGRRPRGARIPAPLFLRHGFTLWDNFWYAGRYAFVGYSVLYYPLAALLGIRLLAVLTVALAAGAFARLLEGSGAARAGRPPFALVWPGVILPAAPVRARRPARAARARAAGRAGAGSSRRSSPGACRDPVAFVLLAVVLAGIEVGSRPGLRLRAAAVPAVALAVAAAAELITVHLFPVGTLGFPGVEAVLAVAFCASCSH